jgi:hypothetical protein
LKHTTVKFDRSFGDDFEDQLLPRLKADPNKSLAQVAFEQLADEFGRYGVHGLEYVDGSLKLEDDGDTYHLECEVPHVHNVVEYLQAAYDAEDGGVAGSFRI